MSDTLSIHDNTEDGIQEQMKIIFLEIDKEKDSLKIQRLQMQLEKRIVIIFIYSAYNLKRTEQNEEMANREFKLKAVVVLVGDMTAISKTIAKIIDGAFNIGGGVVMAISPFKLFADALGSTTAALTNLGQGITGVAKGADVASNLIDGYNQADQTKSQYDVDLRKNRGNELSQDEREDGSREQKAEQQAHDLEQARHRAAEAMMGG